MIIDCHVHLPAVSKDRSHEQSKLRLLADLEKNHIDHAILIPDNIPDSPIGNVETCIKIFHGVTPISLLGTIDIRCQGREWVDFLETLVIARKIAGMKIFPGHDPFYPTDQRFFPVYEMCQRHRALVVIHTGQNLGDPESARYNDSKHIIRVAGAYPELIIVIAHYFWPEVEYCHEITRKDPNIRYDTSGLADEVVVEATGMDKIKAVLMKTISDSTRKVMFGTDYPMCDQHDHVALIESLPISPEAKDRDFRQNAMDTFLDLLGFVWVTG